MFRLWRSTVTRNQIASICLDHSSWPRNRCFTGASKGLFRAVRVRWKSSLSRPTITTSYIAENEIHGRTLRTGDTVELKDGDFLRVTNVSSDKESIQGWRFCSTTKIRGLPEDLLNEVCWILHTKDGELQDLRKQCVEDIPRTEVIRKRRLILTNQNTSVNIEAKNSKSELVHDQSTLVCRWKYVCCVKSNRRARLSGNVQFYSPDNEWAAIIRLKEDECDGIGKYQIGDKQLRDGWRGHDRKQGGFPEMDYDKIDSYDEDLSRLGLDKLSLSDDKQRHSSSGNSLAAKKKISSVYTFGDAFCGAGGASRGAAMANLMVRWGFDSSFNAYEAYKLNFPRAALLLAATDFITHNGISSKVDVLHLSPPCQAFSQANTTPNLYKDKINIAASMTIGEILSVARPRIVLLEQTPGIMVYKKNQEHCDEVIRQFTRLGFSIRWRVLKFAEYGLPQERARLMIIASSPGEALPSFPRPSHGTKSGLTPLTTVKATIDHIPDGYANHTLTETYNDYQSREPYDGDKPLASTIITHTNVWHYSGKRPHTDRELACLQGFPLTHVFGKREIKRHIGNAVPPLIVKVLLEHIVKSLRERDGLSKKFASPGQD